MVADAFDHHIPKGYIYAAMAFSVLVEAVNIIASGRKRARSGQGAIAPFTSASGSVTGETGVAAAGGTPRARSKTTPAAKAQSRPKSAPRKPRTPRP